MKLNFEYNRDKDIWCILNKGKSSNNSSKPTKVYTALVEKFGDNPSEEETSEFIDLFLKENDLDTKECVDSYTEKWNLISDRYQEIAEKVFNVELRDGIKVYITINGRCPYNIEENYFFTSIKNEALDRPNHIAMHELWHFYTWERFGEEWEEKLGKQKYNDIKESLSVLLNVECKELMATAIDNGYPQHQEMRKEVLRLWEEKKDIEYVWNSLIDF